VLYYTLKAFKNNYTMKNKSYFFFILICLINCINTVAQTSKFIKVDQFGYRLNSKKVAVITDPQTGYDAAESFSPSKNYEVRKYSDNSVAYSGEITAWKNGAVDTTSGDKVWWFDFSSVTSAGSYYIYDAENKVSSYRFEIGDNVYNDVLKAAVRMFFYNRCGATKTIANAGANYADAPSFIGAGQDKNCRSVYDKNDVSTEKDLSGGWWDAGDYNKYVTFATTPVHQLLDAYEQNPIIWGDDYNIPESGNNIPDILDEIKWELDWLKKMQLENGAVLIKMGCMVNNDDQGSLPPSTDKRKRYYYPGGCSSSTIAFAEMMAHGYLILKNIPSFAAYADDMKARAEKAWKWYKENPTQTNCDDGIIQAGNADRDAKDQNKQMIVAAVYLYAATGNIMYRDVVDKNYTTFTAIGNSWWGPYEVAADALLYYTKITSATKYVVDEILNRKKDAATNYDFYKFHNAEKDPYRSYLGYNDYNWGSNMVRSNLSNINYDMVTYNIDANNEAEYTLRAEEILHYFHGVNPFSTVYLTNMKSYGAEKSLTQVYHSWYTKGSDWDNTNSVKGGPAPGYLTGGPNKYYKDANGKCLFTPPCNQPVQKAYRDWNAGWPEAGWELTEPAIYYQSAYIKALSHFVTNSGVGIVVDGK
jgi:endoglucanase